MKDEFKLLRGSPTYTITNGIYEFTLKEIESEILRVRVKSLIYDETFESTFFMWAPLKHYVDHVHVVLSRNFPSFYTTEKIMRTMVNDLMWSSSDLIVEFLGI